MKLMTLRLSDVYSKIMDDLLSRGGNNSSTSSNEDDPRGDAGSHDSPIETPAKKKRRKSSRSSYFMSQVENYLSASNIPRDRNPIEWWKGNQDTYKV